MEAMDSNVQFLETTDKNFPEDRKQQVVERFQQYLRCKTVQPTPTYTDATMFLIEQAKRIGLECKMYVLEEDEEIRKKFPKGHAKTKLFDKFAKDRPFVTVLKWGAAGNQKSSKGDILLHSHMDVVPVETEKWNCDPFEAKIMDEEFKGRKKPSVFARGAQDMKCIAMMYLEAIDYLKNIQKIEISKTGRNIFLTFGPDEEIGAENGMRWVMEVLKEKNSPNDEGRKVFEIDLLSEKKEEVLMTPENYFANNIKFAFDEGLATPNSIFEIFIDERKSCWYYIETTGNVGHGSRFVENTATAKLQPIIDNVFKFRNEQENVIKNDPRKLKDLGDVTSVNLTSMKAGVTHDGGKTFAPNVIPSTAQIGLDMRISPFTGLFNDQQVHDFIKSKLIFSEQTSNFKENVDFKIIYQQKPVFYKSSLIEKFVSEKQSKKVEENVDDKELLLKILNENENEFWFWKAIQNAFDEYKLNYKFGIFPATTDARYTRGRGIVTFGFSPMILHPIRLHDHNEFLTIEMFVTGIKIYEKILSNFLEKLQ